MLPDMERVTRLIADVAALEVMPRFRRLAQDDIRAKARGELVTVADEAVEARLEPVLTSLVPGSRMLGEEAAARDPALLGRLRDDGTVWIVDPIDGTANFVEGRPAFAVMVALARGGKVLASWIHLPVDAVTAVAAAGEGAWMGDRRLAVARAPADAADMTGALHAGFFGQPELARKLQARRDRVRALKSMRCAGLEYVRLARGEMHFLLFSKLMPWDHAPGLLIHEEAGGHARYLEGGRYHPSGTHRSGLLLAPDRESWQSLHDMLLGEP